MAPNGLAAGVNVGGQWQKKLTLIGFVAPCRTATNSFSNCSVLTVTHGGEPKPPASATAITMSENTGPALGARTIGTSTLKQILQSVIGPHFPPSPLLGSTGSSQVYRRI